MHLIGQKWLQEQVLSKRLAAQPLPEEQVTPWHKQPVKNSLDAAKSSAIMSEMQALVANALKQGNASQDQYASDGQAEAAKASEQEFAAVAAAAADATVTDLDSAQAATVIVSPEQPCPASSKGKASKGSNAASKPKWALSEQQAAAAEGKEEEKLLDFAENLDFDAFVHDMEDKELEAAITVCTCFKLLWLGRLFLPCMQILNFATDHDSLSRE